MSDSGTPENGPLRAALTSGDMARVNDLFESAGDDLDDISTDTLNLLLVAGGHMWHQVVAFELQYRGDPSSLPFVCAAIEKGFERLEYTASEHEVIGQWYSWTLAGIGTADAIAAIERYSHADDQGLAAAMAKRLSEIDRSLQFMASRRDQPPSP